MSRPVFVVLSNDRHNADTGAELLQGVFLSLDAAKRFVETELADDAPVVWDKTVGGETWGWTDRSDPDSALVVVSTRANA